jgi:hypothetical protein
MKRIVEWVRTILSRPKAPVEVDQPSKPLSAEDLVMPDIYAEVKTTSNILDLSAPDSDKTRGFNPYDTGRLQKKY